MTKITKERLQQVIDGDILFTDEQREMARMLLAGMEQKPVLYASAETLHYAKHGELHLKCLSEPMGDAVIPLYADPQLTDAERAELESVKAQLKAAQAHITELEMAPPAPVEPGEEPVPVMPDFPGRVMTQRECYRAGWAAHHTAMLKAGALVQFGWSKGHFGYQTLFNAIGKAVKVQGNALSISVSAFEDAMSAAAPQED